MAHIPQTWTMMLWLRKEGRCRMTNKEGDGECMNNGSERGWRAAVWFKVRQVPRLWNSGLFVLGLFFLNSASCFQWSSWICLHIRSLPHLWKQAYFFSCLSWLGLFILTIIVLFFINLQRNQISLKRKKTPGWTHAHPPPHTHTVHPRLHCHEWLTVHRSTIWTSKRSWLYIHSEFSPCSLNSSPSSLQKKNIMQ